MSHLILPRVVFSCFYTTILHSPHQSGYIRCIHHNKITANIQAKKDKVMYFQEQNKFSAINMDFLKVGFYIMKIFGNMAIILSAQATRSYKINAFLAYLNFTADEGTKYSLMTDPSSLKQPFLLVHFNYNIPSMGNHPSIKANPRTWLLTAKQEDTYLRYNPCSWSTSLFIPALASHRSPPFSFF